MLACRLNNEYIEAERELKKGEDYRCPACEEQLIFKPGSKVTPHFSHKKGAECKLCSGETRWHLAGKRCVADYVRAVGGVYQYEVRLGYRITDVLAEINGERWAFELQKKDEGREIYSRTAELRHHVERVVWLFPWRAKGSYTWHKAAMDGDGNAKPRWALSTTASYGINACYSTKHRVKAGVGFFSLEDNSLYQCEKEPWGLYRGESEWYDPEGGYNSAGGYIYKSKGKCEVNIVAQYNFDQTDEPSLMDFYSVGKRAKRAPVAAAEII